METGLGVQRRFRFKCCCGGIKEKQDSKNVQSFSCNYSHLPKGAAMPGLMKLNSKLNVIKELDLSILTLN